jgi:hypothetical protein
MGLHSMHLEHTIGQGYDVLLRAFPIQCYP